VGYLKHKDDSAFPIIYARFEGEATTSGFDEYTTWLDGVTARAAAKGQRFVSVLHVPGKVQIGGDVRRHIGDWTSKQVPTPSSAALWSSTAPCFAACSRPCRG
jgi:hypothetical protein